MICSEVQRTLVKSPPELWAEISDPASLARHLGEFGEICITRVEPEQRVDWEAGDTSGSVVIKPSGWGTKVKLTVTREPPEAEIDADADAPPTPTPGAAPELEMDRSDEQAPSADAGEAGEPSGDADEQPALSEPAHEAQTGDGATREPRRGFFARLFGRRHTAPAAEPLAAREDRPDATPQPPRRPAAGAPYNALALWASQMDPADEAVLEPAADPADVLAAGETVTATSSENAAGDAERTDMSAAAEASEDAAAEEVATVLTGVLDRLGAAHHRPFSRA